MKKNVFDVHVCCFEVFSKYLLWFLVAFVFSLFSHVNINHLAWFFTVFFPFLSILICSPDMTSTVDRALKTNYLSMMILLLTFSNRVLSDQYKTECKINFIIYMCVDFLSIL